LIGYDVEKTTDCAEFLSRMLPIHTGLQAPCTLFALGSCVAAEPDAFRHAADSPLVDIAQHTWSHILLKTVVIDDGEKVELVRGADLLRIAEETARTSEVIRTVCGRECQGITGPWTYYRGLMDRPDILEVLHDAGIRYLRTWGRNEKDYQPVSPDIPPFWYGVQGFPDMLECMVHGWQDVYLRNTCGWSNTQAFVDHMKADLAAASAQNQVFSWSSHDWSSLREDPDLTIVRQILTCARELGMEILSPRIYWARMEVLRRRTLEVVASA